MPSLRVARRKDRAGSFSFAGRQVLWAGTRKVSRTLQLPLLSVFRMAVRVGGGMGLPCNLRQHSQSFRFFL